MFLFSSGFSMAFRESSSTNINGYLQNSFVTYDWPGYVDYFCDDVDISIRGECSFWKADVLPVKDKLYYWYDNGGGGPVNLYIEFPMIDDTICDTFDGELSSKGIANCKEGYLNCISENFNSNMGCETQCDECSIADVETDCVNYVDNNFKVTCNTASHCNFCETSVRPCSEVPDGYCPDNCYYGGNADLGFQADGDCGMDKCWNYN